MTVDNVELNRPQQRVVKAMQIAIAEGARILVVIAQDEVRTQEFFHAMLNLTNDGTQVTLTDTSENEVSMALAARPNHGLLVVDAEDLSPVDQGHLSAMKAAQALPITILVTQQDPGDLMDREGEPGPWGAHFVIKTVSSIFRWPRTEQQTSPQPAPAYAPPPGTHKRKERPIQPPPAQQQPLQVGVTG